MVNLLADVSYAIGAWLRNVQTGYLRSYVLFLALAAMAVWMLLYAWAIGGPERRSDLCRFAEIPEHLTFT